MADRRKYITDAKLATLEENGRRLAESEIFKGVLYEPKPDCVSIHAGACGAINIKWDVLDDLIGELYDLREVYDATYDTGRTMRQAKTKIG